MCIAGVILLVCLGIFMALLYCFWAVTIETEGEKDDGKRDQR